MTGSRLTGISSTLRQASPKQSYFRILLCLVQQLFQGPCCHILTSFTFRFNHCSTMPIGQYYLQNQWPNLQTSAYLLGNSRILFTKITITMTVIGRVADPNPKGKSVWFTDNNLNHAPWWISDVQYPKTMDYLKKFIHQPRVLSRS